MEGNSVNNIFNIDDEITLNLKEWFSFLCNKIYIIIIFAITGVLLSLVITKLLISPTYISETEVYVMARQNPENNVTFNDLELSSQLSADYIEFALSRPVLEQVAGQLNFDINIGQLAENITIETAADARILHISVKNENPENAKKIADAVREAANQRFTEIVGMDSATTIEEANLPAAPSSPNLVVNLLIGGIIAFIIVCVILTLIYLRDDTLKTTDDVEHYLGLNVLASIPIRDKGFSANTTSGRDLHKAARKRYR